MTIEDDVPGRYRALCDRALSGRSQKAAIRGYCLGCVCWSWAEVKLCVCPGCPLFAYRLTGNSLRDGESPPVVPADRRYEPPAHYRPLYERALSGRDRAAAIRANCLMCTDWSRAGTQACEFTDCSLWPYRLTGRRRTGHRKAPPALECPLPEALLARKSPGGYPKDGSVARRAPNPPGAGGSRGRVQRVGRASDAIAERDENTCRLALAPSEWVAIVAATEPLEREAAKERQGRPGQERSGKFPEQAKKADSRDAVADVLGVSGKTYEKAKAVVEAAAAE